LFLLLPFLTHLCNQQLPVPDLQEAENGSLTKTKEIRRKCFETADIQIGVYCPSFTIPFGDSIPDEVIGFFN
jgi:hypothetical protein